MDKFELVSEYKPSGDQPKAIQSLSEGVLDGLQTQVLVGVTGSGKTFTMANIIEKVNRPTLVVAHNKTLAAQLCSEFKELFPNNRVEYFVSYYDYYRPEAYLPGKDIYIEKDMETNQDIDRMRYSAIASLQERRDVIVVASVSCIYGLGDPDSYTRQGISLRPGMEIKQEELIKRLIEIQYERNDVEFVRGVFRVRGDVLDIFPVHMEKTALRIEFFGDEIERITETQALTGTALSVLDHVMIFPASMYATATDRIDAALEQIAADALEQQKMFERDGRLIEAQRIAERTTYDLEMLAEMGFCSGIENYSRYFDGRKPGEPPYTLLDYFPEDFLMIIDESHVSIPQIRSMHSGDSSRKKSLVEYGFRLPSAYDNRPLNFDEFTEKLNQLICVSATPGDYELEIADNIVEQIIRPTGLLDPETEVRPVTGQVDDLIGELTKTIERGFRAMVVTLTKKMAEDLTDYLSEMHFKVRYMHSDVHTMERVEILRDLRLGVFDVLVGINLMREGLDLPEVSLVAILDADKEGFLRNRRSLIQTIGRAARNAEGRVILYGDKITDSMQAAITETARRREIQSKYNEEHGIVPKTIIKQVYDNLDIKHDADSDEVGSEANEKKIILLEQQMLEAAENLDFELAARLRDRIYKLQGKNVVKHSQKKNRKYR